MRQEFIDYLEKNLMEFTEVSPYVFEIGGKTFELYKEDEQGAMFDDDFRFTGLPANPDRYNASEQTVDTEADFYAYKFGGVWYMLPKDGRDNVKLKRIKYIGTAVKEMPMDAFLCVHGQYELLSGSGTYSDWCAKAKFYGVQTLGICERNTLAGALKFQAECLKNGLKPVIGMECSVYDVQRDYKFAVKVYVKDEEGWRVLLTINKAINCDYPKYIPLTEFEPLISSNLDHLFLILDPKTTDYDKMKLMGLDYIGAFQLDPVRYNEESRDKAYLINLKKYFQDIDLVPIPMCDAWYLDEEYSCIRARLASIGGGNFYDSDDQYFKNNDRIYLQLAEMFPDDDLGFEAVYTYMTQGGEYLNALLEDTTFKIDTSQRHLPRYKMTEEEAAKYETNEDLFWGLIDEGLQRHPELIEKYGEEVVYERIEREVGVIKLGDTIDYFLIVRDIINWCRDNDIMTGVARGSAGGCLVSLLLAITKLNPLEYDLLFERFLNEGRVKVSLPDIDTDYPGIDRPRVKKYMEERYGAHQVCSVGTYSALQLRAALKDLSRIYGLEFQEVNEMMKLFAVDDRKPEDLFKIACAQTRVKKFVIEHPDIINEVMLVMPAPKSQSIHACATMIFPDEHDMFRWVPIRKQGDEYVTEWEGGEMDAAGFLKNDILGVKQLDKFQDMVRLVGEHEGDEIDIFNIPLDDSEVYRYFQNGWNEDNFHFGSRGLTGYCKQMKPANIDELIAAISLYRPGAMENGFHEQYIKRKEGRENVEYFTGTNEILQPTYGVFAYQEQIMELCKQLGGLSLVEADDVRKAMVKKKYEALHQYHERFTPYYMEHFGVTYEYAEKVWEAIDKASTYLFNKCIDGRECLQGVTVEVNPGQLIQPSIDWLFHNYQEQIARGELKTLSFDVERFRVVENTVKGIYDAGMRQTLTITLENEAKITVTENHKFPTLNGERRADELKKGDTLFWVALGRNGYTVAMKIHSIKKNWKKIQVYDVEMADPYHNFITTEHIVTCNSHAAAYALTGYISQWMKVHYPIEYWSVAFKYAEEADYPKYIAEINKTGVCTVRPVDINISNTGVVINFKEKALYWSLMGVKQVAERAATQILKERDENGQYWSLEDFVSRHKWKGSAVNTRVIQNLILSGAFDSVESVTNARQRVDLLVNYIANNKVKVDENDPILVGADRHANDDWWWQLMQKKISGLAFFDYLFLYNRYKDYFPREYAWNTFEQLVEVQNRADNGYVIVGGYLADVDIKRTKKGDTLCRLTIENNYEFIEMVVFNNEYQRLEQSIQAAKNNLVLVNASLYYDTRNERSGLRATMETNIIALTL